MHLFKYYDSAIEIYAKSLKKRKIYTWRLGN